MDGIDVEKVTDWMVTNTPPITPPLTFDLIAGGRSNLTYAVTDAVGRKVVLRRPPVSHVLASAHDMGREYRVISALQDTNVPVPETYGYCDDPTVNGASFYVMSFMDGYILRTLEDVEAAFPVEKRLAAGLDLADVLVDLHNVDPDEVGLGDLGKREDYLGRQLKRWNSQFHASQDQAREGGVFRPAEIVTQVHDQLVAMKPEQQRVSLAHADYRLDNCMYGADGKIIAVLDWELCTLGDPVADLATMLMFWADREDEGAAIGAASAAPGFPTRAELIERYASKSDLDLSDLNYYIAFAHWRLACILEGVFVRFATGAMADASEESVKSSVAMGNEVIRRSGLAQDLLAQK
ncbi:MAG: phosphotransferase family protein [Acidimicrobiia bacterium]